MLPVSTRDAIGVGWLFHTQMGRRGGLSHTRYGTRRWACRYISVPREARDLRLLHLAVCGKAALV